MHKLLSSLASLVIGASISPCPFVFYGNSK